MLKGPDPISTRPIFHFCAATRAKDIVGRKFTSATRRVWIFKCLLQRIAGKWHFRTWINWRIAFHGSDPFLVVYAGLSATKQQLQQGSGFHAVFEFFRALFQVVGALLQRFGLIYIRQLELAQVFI